MALELGPSSGTRVTTRANRTKCDYSSPVARPFKGTSRSRAPLIRTIPSMNPTSKNAKQIIWRKHFGVRGLFAFSGSSNAGSVPSATPRSPGSRVGAFIIASPVLWVVLRVRTTASCSIQSAMTGFIANVFPYRNRVSLKEAFQGLEPDEGKLSRPVLRGLALSNGGRLLGSPTSRNAKEFICRKRFGVRGLFAFSGSSNAGPVPCATPRSPGPLVGVFIITSPVHWVVPRVQKTASCSIQSATTGFIANIFPYRNRVSLKEAFEGPEPYDGKLSRPVLRGLAPSNGGRPLGDAWLHQLPMKHGDSCGPRGHCLSYSVFLLYCLDDRS